MENGGACAAGGGDIAGPDAPACAAAALIRAMQRSRDPATPP
jgi:hypothetical protein